MKFWCFFLGLWYSGPTFHDRVLFNKRLARELCPRVVPVDWFFWHWNLIDWAGCCPGVVFWIDPSLTFKEDGGVLNTILKTVMDLLEDKTVDSTRQSAPPAYQLVSYASYSGDPHSIQTHTDFCMLDYDPVWALCSLSRNCLECKTSLLLSPSPESTRIILSVSTYANTAPHFK